MKSRAYERGGIVAIRGEEEHPYKRSKAQGLHATAQVATHPRTHYSHRRPSQQPADDPWRKRCTSTQPRHLACHLPLTSASPRLTHHAPSAHLPFLADARNVDASIAPRSVLKNDHALTRSIPLAPPSILLYCTAAFDLKGGIAYIAISLYNSNCTTNKKDGEALKALAPNHLQVTPTPKPTCQLRTPVGVSP
ncbi:hypothetical protein PDE_06245 [Penicillium oxalicum 114-2]|uniref:Uncharacterized protein n=1 Tax=Penicillium oxalicum (strain 114-2 / CGMCC 5302) TaxID=933388 RepID=S7ZKZ1_PENO1|nr:hypothetical protein PDE_06245 [Penicillium oxalicum 114-2]